MLFRYVTKRVLAAIPLIFTVLTLSFFLVKIAPGSPFNRPTELPQEVRESLARTYGIDQPLHIQYLKYMSNAVRGHFGLSYTYRSYTASEIIAEHFPVSARIGLSSVVVSVIVGVLLGTLAALKHNSWIDYVTVAGATFGKSIPSMVLAPLVAAIVGLHLKILPVAWDSHRPLVSMIAPVICLSIYDVTSISRLMRGSMLEVLRTKYLVTARAKGLRETRVMFVHALREAVLPLISYLGPLVSGILCGTVVVERVFNVPGLGRYTVDAAINRDYTLVLATVALACVLLISFNILVDIFIALLDPRIRVR